MNSQKVEYKLKLIFQTASDSFFDAAPLYIFQALFRFHLFFENPFIRKCAYEKLLCDFFAMVTLSNLNFFFLIGGELNLKHFPLPFPKLPFFSEFVYEEVSERRFEKILFF
jgi:hypothetical protein